MKEMKRILSLVLCLVMLVGILPVNAFATETGATEPAAPTEAAQVLETEATETTAPSEPEETTVPSEPEGTTAPSEPEGTTAPTEDTVVTETTEATEATLPVPPMLPPMIFGSVSEEAMVADQAAVQADYLMFATDRHGSTSAIAAVLSNMESKTGGNIEYVGLGGDMVDGQSAYNTSTMLTEVNNGLAVDLTSAYVDITKGSHDGGVNDDSGMFHAASGELIEADEYAVYGVIQSDMESDTGADEAFVTWASGIDASKVIIVLSHLPLHEFRNDNYGATGWHQALNSVAAGDDAIVDRDVIFFHGHNHSQDGASNYCYEVGEGLTVEGTSGTVTNYYTYATAGYLNDNGEASLVTITDTTFNVTRYGSSGSGDDLTGTITRVTPATTPTVNTVTASCTADGEENLDTVTAVGIGLTAVSAEWNDEAADNAAFSDCVSYDVTLTGYTGDDEVDLTFCIDSMTAEDLVVYVNGTATESFTATENEDGSLTVALTQSAAEATYIIGKLDVSEGAAVTGIEVTTMPDITNYTLVVDNADDGNLYLDITGLVVTATYDNGETAEIEWNRFDETKDGYALTFDLTTAGTKTVTITYGEYTTSFEVTVHEFTATDNSGDETVVSAVSSLLKSGYVSRDITLTDYTNGTDVKVVMPAPEGADTVYYVAEDGTATKIEGAEFADGYVTFITNHFSTYVVGENTEITVPDPETATGRGDVTTTEEKEVYVLVSTPTAGNQYIIVNRNTAGTGYALKENTTTGSSITVNAAGNGISDPYIDTTDETIMWNAASGMTFQSENGGYYLRYNDRLTFSTSNSTNWTYSSSNTLYYRYSSNRNYYVYNSDGTWTASRSTSDEVYLYEKQTVEVETTTTASGTYSIAGNPAEVTKIVKSGTTATATLGSTLTFTPDDGGTATTNENPSGVSYSVVEGGDPANVISDISGNTVTFSGNYGKALVKVSYETAVGTVTNYITVNASEPTYTLEIEQGASYIHKGVQSGQTLDLNATVKYLDGTNDDGETVENPTLVWSIESGTGATIDASTGVLTFDGTEGELKVKVAYEVNETTTLEQYITVHIRKSTAITPEESTTDFPRWPNEGAVRFDKTATAVGNFSNTGVAQLELSMAGIPQKTGGAVDVVLMLDMTGSMDTTEMAAAEAAAQSFADQIIMNDDGTFNDSRIAIYAFNSGNSSPYELWAMSAVTEDTYSDLQDAIASASDKKVSGGTPYDEALSQCRTTLQNTKIAGRQQFCVFVSDGAPTSFAYVNNYDSASGPSEYQYSTDSASGGTNASDSNYATMAGRAHEYYSTMMKEVDGVTVYTVGTGLSSSSDPNALEILRKIASDDSKTYNVDSASDTDGIKDAFAAIAEEINAAATDIEVTDKITEDYEMVFKWPDAVDEEDKVAGQEFYIEVVNYTLDETTHERTGEVEVLTRIYLTEDSSGNLNISKLVKIATDGTETSLTTTSAYTAVEEGEKGYFNLVDGSYVYVSDGTGAYNMTEGATVTGTADTVVLHTPYFSYDASTKIIKWHVSESEEGKEIALRYFLYLTNSLESASGAIKEYNDDGTKNPAYVPAGTYSTNDYATLEYENFRGNEVMQFFPEPQLTWNGAQVTYIFYLVNSDGEPVNMAGRVVQFNEAVFVTKPQTKAVVWNNDEGTANLLAEDLVADALMPDDYTLYDTAASYTIRVYEDETGYDLGNYFVIGNTSLVDSSGNSSTKVYNTKAGVKYAAPGTYASQNKQNEENVTVIDGFDFANTTVAFAVVWERKLVEDTVVVDFGLPVDINVTKNDLVSNNITAIGTETPSADINDGLYTESALSVKVDETTHTSSVLTVGSHTAQVMNENVVRFTPGTMEFKEPVTFNYETKTDYYETSAVKEGYLYSTVTVIPATTVYYEDSFVDFQYIDAAGTYHENGWTTEGTTENKTQEQDRPGENVIFENWDANNVYGYDAAYANSSTFSLGSARKITVDANKSGVASFSFYGTGFDVVSMTSNKTGTIIVDVYKGKPTSIETIDTELTKIENGSLIVDTYYGYTKNANGQWVVDATANNALYQVPVMNVSGLDYGLYTVRIVALYDSLFDHNAVKSYDFYLDAIRIYDPTNDGASDGTTDTTVEDAYTADGERWPIYQEIRNNVISAANFNQGLINGIAFIDGDSEGGTVVADYVGYGPNNELYLAPGQSVVFGLDLEDYGDTVESVHLGMKSADGSAITYALVDAADLEESTDLAVDLQNAASTLTGTSTDMYYDITNLKDTAIVVYNAGTSGTISLTNVKITFKQKPAADLTNLFYVDYDTIMNIVDAFGRPSTDSSTDVTGTLPISCPATVIEGVAFPVTVNVSESATNVTVNGISATYSTEAGAWIAYVTAPTGVAEMTVTASATVDGEAQTATATVQIAPYVKIELPASVKAGTQYEVRIYTAEGNTVTVNGITLVKDKDYNGVYWTASITAGSAVEDSAEEEAVEVTVTANGNTTTVKGTVDVYSDKAFVPSTFTVNTPASVNGVPTGAVQKGKAASIKITTSSDVEKIILRGGTQEAVITTYRTSGTNRIWTTRYVVCNADSTETSKVISAYACDENGYESEAKTITFNITDSAISTIAETIKNRINSFIEKLFG